MKRIAGGLLAVIAVAWLALSPQGQQMLSPGPVGGDHNGRSFSCTKCHTPFAGVPDTNCMECHKAIKRLVDGEAQGLHSITKGACRSCHSTHRGRGHIAPRNVDHSKFGFTLEEHERVSCKKCHGKKVRRAKQSLCHGCHLRIAERKDSARMIEHLADTKTGPPECWGCHSGGDRVEFRHSPKLAGSHRGVGCRECHRSEATLPKSPDCSLCHGAPAAHYKGSCTKCHSDSRNWNDATFDHPRVREHSYRAFACVKCHPGGYSSSSCTSCHDSDNPDDDDEGEHGEHDDDHGGHGGHDEDDDGEDRDGDDEDDDHEDDDDDD